VAPFISGLLVPKVTSSAYSAVTTLGSDERSLIITLNKNGERMAPWETPDFTDFKLEISPSKCT
jgi:hypothetical protein